MNDIGKIAVGVFIGALAALFAYEAITVLRVRVVAEWVARQMKQELEAQRQATEARRQREAQAAEQRRRQEAAQQEAQRAAVERQRAQRQAEAEAWRKFYQPSPACQRDSATVECANAFMRARKQFEQSYRPAP